jgi:3-phenylpropionate/trans-cinnamate dioxygenase ferredoxin reductase subunit
MSVVIIGGGHGGASAAFELRRGGYSRPITIVGEEGFIPYQRPPLSKAWLRGEADHDSLALRPREWYVERDVTLRLGTRSVSIDRQNRSVTLADHSILPFSELIIATGARARRLGVPGANLDGVLTLRTTEDADRLRQSIRPGARIAIVGAGYVGLETAASARALGAAVIVMEREARVLARVACPALSEFFTTAHRAEGVQFELAADVVRFIGDTHVQGIELADGRIIRCDAAVVGVGAIPNDEIARECGLPCADGIIVDQRARTADPAVFAIGDVTRRPVPRYDRQVRLESVPNALEQARQAAATICGLPAPAAELPWFWSDQYDLKLQIAGMAFACNHIVVRGDPAGRSFSLFHLCDEQVEAVEAVNAPGDFMFGKALIARRLPIIREKLADPAVPIRETAA